MQEGIRREKSYFWANFLIERGARVLEGVEWERQKLIKS
jgi:hypothetical protein